MRLIDADHLKERVYSNEDMWDYTSQSAEDLVEYIDREPTAEPKVGEWIDTGENLHKCSNCGQIIFSQTPYDLEMFHAYCGRCGAKMERRNDEHNTERD